MSKTHLRTTKFVLLIIVLSIALAIPVFAYHFNNISWQQGPSPQIFIGEKDFNGPITFDGVATSPNEGYFKVELQKQGFFWSWHKVGHTYTVRQFSGSTYSLRDNSYVTGQYFKLSWADHGSGKYRVRLYAPTEPQSTVLSRIYLE